jgi:hypothetical protein
MATLDINALLCDEERIPCKFLKNCNRLGHLDPAGEEKSMLSETRVDLPLWLGEHFQKKLVVELEAPKHFGSKMQEEMKAGAAAINLREFSYYFFEVGLRISDVLANKELQRRLRDAFVGDRYRNLTVRSLTQGGMDDISAYCQALTSSELVLFTEGVRSMQNIEQWRSTESTILKRAQVLGRRDRSERDDSTLNKRARA